MYTINSVTTLDSRATGHVVIAGSHGGTIAGWYAAKAQVKAVILNDAGVGKDHSGVSGLDYLEKCGIAAATVHRYEALIGNAEAMLCAHISYVNYVARNCGVYVGEKCEEAAKKLAQAPSALPSRPEEDTPSRHGLAHGVVGCDSYGCIEPDDSPHIIVCGSHSALHTAPDMALPFPCKAAFFHDAAAHGDAEGLARITAIDARCIPAFAVDYRSARIGDARSMYDSGIVSFCNKAGASLGVTPMMTVQAAIRVVQSKARQGAFQ
jgi:uncharacterized protein YunC (DUF1805 family)